MHSPTEVIRNQYAMMPDGTLKYKYYTVDIEDVCIAATVNT